MRYALWEIPTHFPQRSVFVDDNDALSYEADMREHRNRIDHRLLRSDDMAEVTTKLIEYSLKPRVPHSLYYIADKQTGSKFLFNTETRELQEQKKTRMKDLCVAAERMQVRDEFKEDYIWACKCGIKLKIKRFPRFMAKWVDKFKDGKKGVLSALKSTFSFTRAMYQIKKEN